MRAIVLGSLSIVIASATGAQGPPGATGPGADGGPGMMDATMPTDGPSGSDAPVSNPIPPTLSQHAQIGLASAPVPLALAGKTPAQLEQIGQGAYIVATQGAC